METIKDLELLITDGEKIARFAKLFIRLPDILQSLSAANTKILEADKEVESKRMYLKKVQSDIDVETEALKALRQRTSIAKQDAVNAEAIAKKKLDDAEAEVKKELEIVHNENAVAVKKAKDDMHKKVSDYQHIIKTAEDDVKMKLEEHEKRMSEMKVEEKDALERVEQAKTTLAKLKESL